MASIIPDEIRQEFIEFYEKNRSKGWGSIRLSDRFLLETENDLSSSFIRKILSCYRETGTYPRETRKSKTRRSHDG